MSWCPGPAGLIGGGGGRAGASGGQQGQAQYRSAYHRSSSAVGVGVRWEQAAVDVQGAMDTHRVC